MESTRKKSGCLLFFQTIPCRVSAPVVYQKLCTKVKLRSSFSGSTHSVGLILMGRNTQDS